MWGISTESPLTSSAISSKEFRNLKRSHSSIVWALRIVLLDSISLKASSFSLIFSTNTLFSLLNRLISLVKSSRSFCFFILDLLADSLFDSILFLFLSSITSDLGSSDPELAGRWFEAIIFTLKIQAEQKKSKLFPIS